MKLFEHFELPTPLLKALQDMGFETPTPIQAKTIPIALSGRDVLGTAQTGTGKTAAYLIPMITHMILNPKSTSLILVPTRELAHQVLSAAKSLTKFQKIFAVSLIGGEPIHKQLSLLKSKPRIVIGTPGRIQDHLDRRTLFLKFLDIFVLDEMDRMLDMGFAPQIDDIQRMLPIEKQTLMFSATLPKKILNVANEYLNDPVRISVGEIKASINIEQTSQMVQSHEKLDALVEKLSTVGQSAIVFAKTKYKVDHLSQQLFKRNIKALPFHGDLTQSKRNQTLSSFRNKNCKILVATDLAARGLDIPHVELVINYDLPQSKDDYIHRIGRTGRAEAKGEAFSLLSREDSKRWRQMSVAN